MKTAILFLLLLMPAPGAVTITTYYIVRHAEKLNATPDTPLSAAGNIRARVLREYLRNKGIDSVFTTTFLRTKQTAQPTATLFMKTLKVHSGSVVNIITDLQGIRGKEVLVVGHSNTVPEIVKGLSGKVVPAIAENDFDNLYIVKVKTSPGAITTKTMTHITYGAPTP